MRHLILQTPDEEAARERACQQLFLLNLVGAAAALVALLYFLLFG